MVIDLEKLLWDLFKKTGNVKYYLLYNKVKGVGYETDSRGDNTKRN